MLGFGQHTLLVREVNWILEREYGVIKGTNT